MDGSLTAPHLIRGNLSASQHISGTMHESASIMGALSIPVYVDVDLYSGEYVVKPDFVGHSLDTSNKTLTEDIRVEPIEVQVTTNTSGGKTVYIGGI